jgi:DNA-binding IclR family transcriptional regulator
MKTNTMKILTEKGIITDRDGYIQERGVAVAIHDETATQCAVVSINATTHRLDDMEITDHSVTSKLAGWAVSW